MNFPVITSQQMAQVDRLAIENGLEIKQMMEYAGLSIARFIQQYVKPGNTILILSGKGHNGGDGLAAARHLKNWGYKAVVIFAMDPDMLKETSKHHFNMLKKMSIQMHVWNNLDEQKQHFDNADLIIDALLGYNIDGDPRDKYKEVIHAANDSTKPIIAIDLSSGLNGETGEAYNPCINAMATLTLALPKTGLMNTSSKSFVGELFVADLGIPEFVYREAGISVPTGLFKSGSIQKIS